MPKLKTHKGAAKRFKKTGTGKVKRSKAYLRHILTSKDKKRKSQLGTSTLVSDADAPSSPIPGVSRKSASIVRFGSSVSAPLPS